MNDAFICDAIRTPIGRYGGALKDVRADDLGAVPIKALIERNPGVDWQAIDDVIYGCANQAGEDNRNVARMAALLAGLPPEALPAGLPPLREALHTLHHPPPRASLLALEDRSHPAWQRLKAEELLAQQLSQLQARRAREQLRAPPLRAGPGGLRPRRWMTA